MKTKIELVCPKCEAHLSVDAKREVLFCEYCGTKILLNDENTYTIRHVDEAELMHAENKRLIYLKEIELAEKEAETLKERNKSLVKFSILLTFIGVFLIIIGFVGHSFSPYPALIIISPFGGLIMVIALCLVLSTFFPDKK